AGRERLAAQAGAAQRTNVVVIMTDDQQVGTERFMPNVQRLLARRGTTFKNFYTSYPLCCPSRSTFLTGQYAHNHGVLENSGNHGGFHALDHTNTLPVWLQAAGYHTALV